MLARVWRNLITHTLLEGMPSGRVTPGKHFGSFLKKNPNPVISIWLSNCTHGYLSQRKWKTYIHAKTCTQIFLLLFYLQQPQTGKELQMSFLTCIVRQIRETATLWRTTSNHEEQTTGYTDNMDESPENYMLSEKKVTPIGYRLCDSIYTTFLRWQNYRNGGHYNCQELVKRCGSERDGLKNKTANSWLQNRWCYGWLASGHHIPLSDAKHIMETIFLTKWR